MGITFNQTNASSVSSTSYVYFFLPSLFIAAPLGIPANVIVLQLLLGKAGICSTSEVFSASQAFMDLAFCVGLCIEVIHNLTMGVKEFLKCLAFNQFGGPMHLTFMCLDSYLGVLHPVAFMKLKTPLLRLSICIGIWVLTVLYFLCTLLLTTFQSWGIAIAQLIIDLLIIYFCLIQVLWTLKKPGPGGTVAHPVKKRAFKIVLGMFILVNLHYCLPIVNYAVRNTSPSRDFNVLSILSSTLLSLASCIQPIFYLLRMKKLPLPPICQK